MNHNTYVYTKAQHLYKTSDADDDSLTLNGGHCFSDKFYTK